MIRFILLSTITLILGCTQNKSALDLKLTEELNQLRQASGYPGVVFAYVTDHGKPHAIASGWANMEDSVTMTKDHLMHSGSTGKVLVSGLIMRLAQNRKIKLDDPVSLYFGAKDWFDQLPNDSSITIRHLLQHSSGIARYEFKDAFISELGKDADRVWKPEELLAFVLGDTALFGAGEGFGYADTNYILLGMIIEQVTGERFYDLAKKEILAPLQIESFTPTNTRKIPGMAQGYYDPESEYALGFKSPFLLDGIAQNNMQFEWTGGGYAYKTSDYALLLKYIYEGKVFDLNVMGEDFFTTIPSPEIGGEYGLGLQQLEFPELGTFIGHGGFFPGYNTMGLYHPESRMAFVMQINITNLEQLRRFYGDYLKLISMVLSEHNLNRQHQTE
jgi:D-alanyl-D-alanine carboxypeptidase